MVTELMQMVTGEVPAKARRIQDEGQGALERYVVDVFTRAELSAGLENVPARDINLRRMVKEMAREDAIAELLNE